MKFDPTRCVQCGNPDKTNETTTYPTQFFFCSEKCASDAIDELCPKEFRAETYKGMNDHPDTNKINKAFYDQYRTGELTYDEYLDKANRAADNMWRRFQERRHNERLRIAKEVIVGRLRAEWDIYLKKKEQEEREEKEKEEARLAKEAEKERERIAKEAEKEAQKKRELELAEREKAQLELDKLLILREKKIPENAWFEGCWILAPPGRGKTVLLKHLIARQLHKVYNLEASIVIMDSKGDLMDYMRRLYSLEPWAVLLDPENTIAINPFDIPKETVRKGISRLEHLFSSILDGALTPKQTALFRPVVRAMILGFHNPTLETFIDILTNGVKKYRNEIASLPSDLQDFFKNEFDESYDATKLEILWRLRTITEIDFLKKMMFSKKTRFHMGKHLDAGRIIIINNNQDKLDIDGAEFFGRFFLGQIWAAATARSLRQGPKKPVYVFIDEAATVIYRDTTIAKIIAECRSANISIIMAHQWLDQIKSKDVLAALSNCAIRISNADDDAKEMAEKLRTTEEHFASLKVGQFACYVRDVQRTAFTMNVPVVTIGPVMGDDYVKHRLAIMEKEYGDDSPSEPPDSQYKTAEKRDEAEAPPQVGTPENGDIGTATEPVKPTPWKRKKQ